ncbi:MAG: hypothetical protein KA444_00905 [Bacteroidia bacterium]|nr:hypothetical protein [Bacteroidia bacterium]
MKKRLFALAGSLVFLSILILYTGCKKEKDDELEFDTQSSQDNSLAEASFNDLMDISNQAIDNGNAGLSTYRLPAQQGSLLSNCATVNLTPDSSGQGGTIVVDFGQNACKCDDFRYRKGIVNVTYSDNYRDSGAVITTTLTDYFVGLDSTNMYQVMGTKTVTNMGHNSLGHQWFTIDVNGQLKNRNNEMMSWTSQRQREWLEGESTTGLTGWADDVYGISGTASGTTFEGKSFTANITKKLIVELDCRWIKEGTFELRPGALAARVFDYGNATDSCNNDATITVNGATFNIKLR